MLKELIKIDKWKGELEPMKMASEAWLEYKHDPKPLRMKLMQAMLKVAGEIKVEFERLPPEADRNERMNRELKKLIGLEMNDKSKRRNPIYYLNKKEKGVKNNAVYLPKSAWVAGEDEFSANLAGDRVSSVNLSDAGGNQKRKLDQPENVKDEIRNAKSEGGVRMRESEIARDGMAPEPNLRGLPMTPPFKRRGDAPVGMEKGQASPTSTTTRTGTIQRSSPRAISAVTLGRSDSTPTSSERKRKK